MKSFFLREHITNVDAYIHTHTLTHMNAHTHTLPYEHLWKTEPADWTIDGNIASH
jgi:hypothetical protein